MTSATAPRTRLPARGPVVRRGPVAARGRLSGYLFVSPACLLFLVFIGGPFLYAAGLSLFNWDLLTPPRFAGLGNFTQLASDHEARRAILNTFIFAFASVVTHISVGLALALAVNRKMNTVVKYVARTSFFFPFLISWAAVALLWKYVLDPSFGIANYYLHLVHLPTSNWLASPSLALPSLIVVDFWHTIGYTFIILLAGLQTVPAQLNEAAMVDGAGPWQRFWHITLPVMSPTVFFATVITFIGAFQIFEPMLIMTAGGPNGATESIVLDIYSQGFQSFKVGYASALALVVFAVIMGVTLLQFRLSRYWVHQ